MELVSLKLHYLLFWSIFLCPDFILYSPSELRCFAQSLAYFIFMYHLSPSCQLSFSTLLKLGFSSLLNRFSRVHPVVPNFPLHLLLAPYLFFLPSFPLLDLFLSSSRYLSSSSNSPRYSFLFLIPIFIISSCLSPLLPQSYCVLSSISHVHSPPPLASSTSTLLMAVKLGPFPMSGRYCINLINNPPLFHRSWSLHERVPGDARA